jgi:hypothetical protein
MYWARCGGNTWPTRGAAGGVTPARARCNGGPGVPVRVDTTGKHDLSSQKPGTGTSASRSRACRVWLVAASAVKSHCSHADRRSSGRHARSRDDGREDQPDSAATDEIAGHE